MCVNRCLCVWLVLISVFVCSLLFVLGLLLFVVCFVLFEVVVCFVYWFGLFVVYFVVVRYIALFVCCACSVCVFSSC